MRLCDQEAAAIGEHLGQPAVGVGGEQLAQEHVEPGALLGREVLGELGVGAIELRRAARHRLEPLGGRPQRVGPAVGGAALALDEAVALEVVDEPPHDGAVQPQALGQPALRDRGGRRVERHEDAEVARGLLPGQGLADDLEHAQVGAAQQIAGDVGECRREGRCRGGRLVEHGVGRGRILPPATNR